MAHFDVRCTDRYKPHMAAIGYPLREEVFEYVHRRGGVQYVPFDLAAYVKDLLPRYNGEAEGTFSKIDLLLTPAMRIALYGDLRVSVLSRGSWFLPGEPILTVRGPSALGSHVEPTLLWLHYPIQLATLALVDPDRFAAEVRVVTCEGQRDVVRRVCESLGISMPKVEVDSVAYHRRVYDRAKKLVEIVESGDRLFEVGMRSATCMEQHEIALRACAAAGIRKTSNIYLADKLGMEAVGTMGHEHVQRFGDDEAAFRAARDRSPGPATFLLDTTDTLRSGLPAALLLRKENDRGDWFRFDSGDIAAQLRKAHVVCLAAGLRGRYILEDGFDDERVSEFEMIRKELKIDAEDQRYGVGGWLIAGPSGTSLTRDAVQAVYKLSFTRGRPTMKFGDGGKKSVPGDPVIWRRVVGAPERSPFGVIAQRGEKIQTGFVQLTDREAIEGDVFFREGLVRAKRGLTLRPGMSSETKTLVQVLSDERRRTIHELGVRAREMTG